jgi:peptidoglycan pentaglycine glycine transferase (the first glycine)
MDEAETLSFWQKNPHRNLWQHPLWQQFQQALGRKTWRLGTEHASALVVRHPLPFGFCWLEIPRGPLFEKGKSVDKLMEEVVELARKEKAIFVRISPFEEIRNSKYRHKGENYEIRNSRNDHHPQTTLVLDLTQTEEQLLAQMKPKGRYNIKVAEKNGITVRENFGVDAFYELLKKTTGRDGFHANPQSYYEKMLQTLGPNAELLMAGKDGQAIAGGIFVYLDDSATYYYGASDHARRSLMAPYLVQWEAIKEAKRRGCKQYDFLGIAPEDAQDHPWKGVTEFKKKFGGTVVQFPPAQELVIRPFWFWAYKLYKRIR